MANPEHLEILKQGVEMWNKWRAENPEAVLDARAGEPQQLDFSGANLRGVNLSDIPKPESSLIETN